MKKTETKKFIIAMFFLGAILAVIAVAMYLVQDAGDVPGENPEIFPDSGFYAKDIEIKVSVPENAKVYYTTNCEKPTAETGTLYGGSIFLPAMEEEQVCVYRFLTVYDDGREPKEDIRTYFVGKQIQNRYQTLVLNVTGDPDGLFGYENGIFVPGKVWDEFWEANPDAHVGSYIEANYTMRGPQWEREVYIQFFDSEGNEILAQNGGVRIQGDQTRIKNQKSFRLYARKEYDVENEFDYPFFGTLYSEENGVLGREYKRLVVRSCGNDNGYGYIRTELVGRLSADAGYPDTICAVPVCVYINGGYYGVYWLENYYDGQYFENRYGAYDGEFVVLEGGDLIKTDSDDAYVQEFVEDYNNTYAEFAAMDMTVEENYRALNQFIDVENYLKYFAIENYVGNSDWPEHNLKVYRYVAEDGQYREDSVFDGRYRFLLFDTDYGFGLLTFNESYGIWAQKPTLYKVISEDTPLFAALMERADCLEYFVNATCDLMNDTMSEPYVTEVVDEMHASRYEELYHTLEETDIMKGSLWESEDSLHIDTADKNIQIIKDFARARPETVIKDIQDTFGLGETYTLKIDKGEAFSGVRINSIYFPDAVFEGTYFEDFTVNLEALMVENEIFDYWEVNGEKRPQTELALSSGDVKDGQIKVRLVTHDAPDPLLLIAAVKAKGHSDYVEIINQSGQVVSTSGYFLSDSDEMKKYALPVMSLKPGDTVRFYGKDCSDAEGLGQFGMNFNLKEGEVVSLSRGEKTVDSVELPKLSSDRGVYTRDFYRDRYIESFQ